MQNNKDSILRAKPKELHYWLTSLLAVALLPALRRSSLPLAFDWSRLVVSYWLVLAAQSVFTAALLLALQSPAKTLECLRQRVRRKPALIVLWAIFFLALTVAVSWLKAVILTVDALAILEVRERFTAAEQRRAAGAVLISALYMFVGFLLVFAYNDVVLSLRFFASADATLNSMDQWLLRGLSVSQICAWAATNLPISAFHVLEFIYFGMFAQIGAALILVSAFAGRRMGLRFVGTVFVAYYLALAIFYLWPSQGPYYLSGGKIPSVLLVRSFQTQSLINSAALWNHKQINLISTDYYIAFPCMHIAQPLIVMWFLRRSRRILAVLAIYNILLLPAIILLEWHYLVDILGGLVVGAIAIVAVNFDTFGQAFAPTQSSPLLAQNQGR